MHEVVEYMDEVVSRALGEEPDRKFDIPEGPHPIGDFLDTADAHKDAGTLVPPRTRLRFLKSLVVRLLRIQTTEQAAYNRAVLATLHALSNNIGAVQADLDQRSGKLQAAVATSDILHHDIASDVATLRAEAEALRSEVEALRTALAEAAERRRADRGETAVLRARLDQFVADARSRMFEAAPVSGELIAREADALLAPLYAQLEEAFRGSRDEVFESQKEYLADVSGFESATAVLDIGPGRGEWLELLKQHDIPAYGVDINPTFVELGRERGLDVRHEDAIEHLVGLPPSSLGAVTAFHLVEHLPFPEVVRLVDAALVALRPGGVLIFETPNPTNVVVGSSAFYLDPTHRNPVHPMFLRFLLEARGFAELELRFLHPVHDAAFAVPDDDPEQRRIVEHLNWAFFGPQDYAVIGRKATPVA